MIFIIKIAGINEFYFLFSANSFDSHPEFHTQKQNVCWDTNGPTDHSKYPVSSYNSPESGVVEITVSSLTSPNSRILNISERQPYYETETINLQDLSSCRGDPMSIVKNLQSIQHNSSNACQVESIGKHASDIDSHKTEYVSKKKMFLDKCALNQNSSLHSLDAASTVTDYLNRVPPPAHHNINQQQNTFFDFDRWTFPSTPTKSFASSSPSPYSSPSNLLPSSYMTNSAQVGSAMNHQGGLTAAAYYNNFHDFNSTVDISSLGHYGGDNSCSSNQSFNQGIREDRPKVIVPDIEEELGFLQQQSLPTIPNKESNQLQGQDPNSGFMTSFLKFLQGDKDPSPPPPMRNARKAASWKKSLPPAEPIKIREKPLTEELLKTDNNIDYTNDPRYFPLPKDRKNTKIESSDDGFSSEEEHVISRKPIRELQKHPSNKPRIVASITIKKPDIKPMRRMGRGAKSSSPAERKRKAVESIVNGDVLEVLKAKKVATKSIENNKVDELSKKHKKSKSHCIVLN